jgi:hypothetical protein
VSSRPVSDRQSVGRYGHDASFPYQHRETCDQPVFDGSECANRCRDGQDVAILSAVSSSRVVARGTRLLHIGPAKTGTTTLQSAMHHNRELIAEHGVHYAGSGRQPWNAASAALGLSPEVSSRPMREWVALADEVRTSMADRVVISSEAFAHADGYAADGILEAFGRDCTHVVITMRPLADMLSSSYWQYVQGGARFSYEAWLENVLRPDRSGQGVTPSFWRRSRIDTLAARWAERVGPDQVTVVSLADRPRDYVLRVFEELTGLPDGILVPHAGESNATLPYPLVELARQFNEISRNRREMPARQIHLTRMGAYDMLKQDSDMLTDARMMATPAWAAERAGVVVGEMNDGIRALGVNVVGDLDALTRPTRPAAATLPEVPVTVTIADAAALMYFMMRSAERESAKLVVDQVAEKKSKPPAKSSARVRRQRAARIDHISDRELLRLLAARVRRRLAFRRR